MIQSRASSLKKPVRVVWFARAYCLPGRRFCLALQLYVNTQTDVCQAVSESQINRIVRMRRILGFQMHLTWPAHAGGEGQMNLPQQGREVPAGHSSYEWI